MSDPCVVCSSGDYEHLAERAGRDVVRCRVCGVVLAMPIDVESEPDCPSANQHTIATEAGFTEGMMLGRQPDLATRRQRGSAKAREIVRRTGRLAPRVLEVGCGVATLASPMAEAGCQYVGLEIDHRVAEIASRNGTSVHVSDLYDFNDQSGFDAVIFSQVLEHSIAPVEFLTHVRRLVRSPGVIICDVPNHASLSGLIARLTRSKTRYGGIEIPHHSIAYSPSSLKYLFELVYSQVETFATSSQDPTWGQVADFRFVGRTYHRVSSILRMPSLAVAVAQVA